MSCIQTHASKLALRASMLLGCLLAGLFNSQPAEAAAVVTTNGDYVMVINATYGEYGEIFDELFGDCPIGDYIPTWFNADLFAPLESAGGGPATASPYIAVNAIFKKNTGDVTFGHEFGINEGDMEDVADLCQAADLQMMQIEAYDTNNGIRYAYLWYDTPGPEWEANIEMTEAGHEIVAGDLEDEGFNAVNICLTETGGSDRVTSLFKKDFSYTFVTDYAILLNDLYFLQFELAEDGYRMTSVEVVNQLGYDTRYLPVFKKNGALAYTYENTSVENIPSETAEINEEEMQGMQPVLIANVFPAADVGLGWWAQPVSYVLWRDKVKFNHKSADDFLYRYPKPPEPGADDLSPETRDPYGR